MLLGTVSTNSQDFNNQLVVLVDEAHNNYHTAEGRFRPFADMLKQNNYNIQSNKATFDSDVLSQCEVLVIANALADQNINNWALPTPSAFTNEEIESVRKWVEEGGSLLLIADHMPFPGCAEDLAAVFGITFNNGFAYDILDLQEPFWCLNGNQIQIFSRSDGGLVDHSITNGPNVDEKVDHVATFTGQAFQGDQDTQPLMVFGPTVMSMAPDVAWEFSGIPNISVDGWYQGAVKEYGNGRAAFFGEAAMFTRQTCSYWSGPNEIVLPMGMNAPQADQNAQFVLNLFLWLTNSLDLSVVDKGAVLSKDYTLNQNYPNPFNPTTTIHYTLPKESVVNITIYDMLGRNVHEFISHKQFAGNHSVQWSGTDRNGTPVSAGIYLYQLQAGDFVQTKKMLLLK